MQLNGLSPIELLKFRDGAHISKADERAATMASRILNGLGDSRLKLSTHRNGAALRLRVKGKHLN